MTLRGGIWHNHYGFTLRDTGRKTRGWPWYRRRTVYEYTADPCHPMTFQFSEHGFVQPDRHGDTDLGSVPEAGQVIIPKDLHNPSFLLHDSACREHGLYFASHIEGPYTFCPIPSGRAHHLLGMCLYAAGYVRRAPLVYRAVLRFGPRWEVQEMTR